jgi:phospholipid N-methyltransferase
LFLKDEEHILTVELNNNFIDLLKNTLEYVNHYIYTINGKQIASAINFEKQLYDDIIIDAQCCTCRPILSVGPVRTPLEIISQKNSA